MTTKIPVELSSTPSIVDNGDATAITIDSSERVGIGTQSPTSNLHVFSSSGNAAAFMQTTNSGSSVSTNYQTPNRIFYTGIDIGGANSAYTIYDGTAGSERMRITSAGNVGIGTTSPTIKLEAVTSHNPDASGIYADAANQLHLKNLSTTDNASSGMIYSSGAGAGVLTSALFPNADTNREAHFIISTANSSGTLGERMRIDSSGNVGIGSPPSTTIRNDIHATEKALQVGRAAMLFSDSGLTTDLNNNSHLNNSDNRVAMTGTLGGSFYAQYNGVHTFYTAAAVAAGNVQSQVARYTINSSGGSNSSDIKLKENIENIPYGLDTIKSLQPRKFKWKETGDQSIGFIAQEVESLIPELISEVYDDPVRTDTSEKTKMLNYSTMTSVLTKAIQEQQAIIEDLQQQINEIKNGN